MVTCICNDGACLPVTVLLATWPNVDVHTCGSDQTKLAEKNVMHKRKNRSEGIGRLASSDVKSKSARRKPFVKIASDTEVSCGKAGERQCTDANLLPRVVKNTPHIQEYDGFL